MKNSVAIVTGARQGSPQPNIKNRTFRFVAKTCRL